MSIYRLRRKNSYHKTCFTVPTEAVLQQSSEGRVSVWDVSSLALRKRLYCVSARVNQSASQPISVSQSNLTRHYKAVKARSEREEEWVSCISRSLSTKIPRRLAVSNCNFEFASVLRPLQKRNSFSSRFSWSEEEKRNKGKGREKAVLPVRLVLKFAFAARTYNFPNFRQTGDKTPHQVPAIRVAVKPRFLSRMRFSESRTVFCSNPGSRKRPSRPPV